MKKLKVVAGIIIYKDKILCMQRNESKYDYISYKYEFPGGKVEPGETEVEALKRELMEEMNLQVAVTEADFFMSVEHAYPDFTITMDSFICRVDEPLFTRKEHIHHEWLTKEALMTLDWAPADLPIVRKLMGETDA